MEFLRGTIVANMVAYRSESVLDAAQERIRFVFDRWDRVIVSISSGKDSGVLLDLARREAIRRGRTVHAFFLDQEAEYQSSIDMIEYQMQLPGIEPMWYQVALRLTNATSHRQYWLNAWGEGEKWMRSKNAIAVPFIYGRYPRRFYKFFEWFEKTQPATAFLVGLRSFESLTRFRSVTCNPGYQGVTWSTKTKHQGSFRFYPIYDWMFGDVWKYTHENGLKYNRLYDRMFAKYGANITRMRVSNLVHERAFRCLADVQEFEPETFNKILARLQGVHAASIYSRESHVFDAKELPTQFARWREYRDYLLETTQSDKIGRFRKRFAKQGDDEEVCRQHCKQVLINDWENNVPIRKSQKEKLKQRLWDKL